ncbi:interleukin-12 subunit alpha [Cololabis saira]|uniref:interleukin-12 subunit alpha n=1 Tax=Cololabis saira TaxID=129043 RepID=UPI002AD26D3F|nr:interleukin-12 subunit alpha [Cololabis saira]
MKRQQSRVDHLPDYSKEFLSDQKHGLSGCALLLLLSAALPVPGPTAPGLSADPCAQLFRDLQLRVKSVVNETFCHGVFTSNEMTVWSQETVQACAPTSTQNPNCMVQRNTSFNETECVSSIMRDLAYHDAAIQSYLSPLIKVHSYEMEVQRLQSVQSVLQSLRKNCNPLANGDNSLEEDTANMWKKDSFENRKKMCKMMRGFHVRAITINRALGYISSGDHRK